MRRKNTPAATIFFPEVGKNKKGAEYVLLPFIKDLIVGAGFCVPKIIEVNNHNDRQAFGEGLITKRFLT